MRLTLSFILLIATAAPAFAKNIDTRKVPGFSAIELSGALELDASPGKAVSVRLEGEVADVQAIVTEVVGSTLKIHPKRDHGLASFWRTHVVRCIVTSPKLTSIAATGACHVTAHGLTGPAFAFTGTGASSAKLDGTVTHFTSTLSGACQVEAAVLHAVDAKVSLSGACHMLVNATQSLNATATGASEVKYVGLPKVTANASGASNIVQR